MKNKILIPLILVGALAAFFSFKYIGNSDDNISDHRQRVINTVMRMVNEAHFSPRQLNDSFSNRVYQKVLDGLDGNKMFFTQKDIDVLSKEQYEIDDQILNDGKVTFFDVLNDLYSTAITRAHKMSDDLLEEDYTFDTNERVQLGGESLPWASDDAALKARWRENIKYRLLAKIVDLKKTQEQEKANKDTVAKYSKMSPQELYKDAKEKVAKSQESYFKRLGKLDEKTRFTFFVNAITGSEDPHTDYFPPKDKLRFDEGMSGSFMGIGAQLKDDDGKIKVVSIIVGSPCWKQGELKAEDIITKVGQGNGEPEDIEGMDIDQVVSKIRGPKGSVVKLTVRKLDGSVKTIPIIRDKVDNEATFAKSAILKSSEGPIGYIYLPEFYADFNTANGRHCSEDIAIEIMKLKDAGVKGMILDLRYNGGGSLSDVVDIAGMFIDKGPVVQVKSSTAPPVTLRDNKSGTLYDGPLAIMVNQGSASASEIMAAAMQDYKRAVIVGTPTFGKGTVQQIVSLDESSNPFMRLMNKDDKKDTIGALKVTMQKFYRINGGSTQLRGVTPDILYPDAYKYINVGERRDKSALDWDEIPAASYTIYNPPVNVSVLAANSYKRIAGNKTFGLVEATAKQLKAKEDDNSYTLNEAAYRKELDEASAISKQIEELDKKGTPLTVSNPKEDLKKINLDADSKKKNEEWKKGLSKDIYLAETVHVITDMLNGSGKTGMGMR